MFSCIQVVFVMVFPHSNRMLKEGRGIVEGDMKPQDGLKLGERRRKGAMKEIS